MSGHTLSAPTDTLAALRFASIARQAEWGSRGAEPLPVLFKATELGGEAGEVLNVVKKLERERLGWQGSRATVEHLADELADLVICADLLAEPYAIDLAAAIVRKFNATSEARGLATRMAESSEKTNAEAKPPTKAAIRLQEGGFYRSYEGKKVGPVYKCDGLWYSRMKAGGGDWYDDGRALHGFPPGSPPLYDLVAEWVQTPVAEPVAAEGLSWRHFKRGSIYTEVGRAELQCSDIFKPIEGDTIVVYRGEDGKLWARGEREFEDGRFGRVEAGVIANG